MQSAPFRLAVALTIIALTSCGGGKGPSGAKHSGQRASGDTSSGWDDTPGAPPRASPCRDETCFECGEGICPTGYYCDETSEPACGWLPSCAAAPDCACVTTGLGGSCACEEREGGLFVSCK